MQDCNVDGSLGLVSIAFDYVNNCSSEVALSHVLMRNFYHGQIINYSFLRYKSWYSMQALLIIAKVRLPYQKHMKRMPNSTHGLAF